MFVNFIVVQSNHTIITSKQVVYYIAVDKIFRML
jgi:hypothetical protein